MRDAGVSSGAGGVWAAPVAGVALGIGAVAAGPLTPYAVAGSVGGVGVAAGSLAAGVWSWRRARRDAALDKLRLALSPLIGGSSVSKVQGSGWSGGWVGTPTRLRLHYDPQVRSHDPKWEPAIRETCQARLGSRFSIEQHDQRQCQIVLRADPVVLESAAAAEVRRRTERNLIRLLGPTAKIVSIAAAEGVATRVEASHEDSPRFAPAGYRARVERAFSDTMPGRWRARWDLERDRVVFEMRPELPDTIWLPTPRVPPGDYLMHNYREVSILLAVDEDGQEVRWYPAKVPHLLACGGTGTGKTSLTHGIVGQFAKFGWPVWISDAKGGEFIDFRDYPNVQIIASSTYQHVALINQALAVVEHRYSLVEAGLAKTRDFTPLVVILDEFAELREDLLQWYPQVKGTKGESKPPTLRQVGRLARKARTARVHLVVALQRPDVAFLTGEMRDNFGQRISFGRLSPQGAMMMWDSVVTGVSLPRGKPGRAIAMNEASVPVEVQCFRFPEMDAPPGSEAQSFLQELRPAEAVHPRLVVVPAEEALAEQLGITVQEAATRTTFWDFARAPWALAADRPDLDPVLAMAGVQISDRQALASPMTVLGLNEVCIPDYPGRVVGRVVGGSQRAARDEPEPSEPTSVEEWPGFGAPEAIPASHVQAGDVVLVDEGLDRWAQIQLPPEEDLLDPDRLAIFWRDADGDEETLSVECDEPVLTRRPVLDAPGYGEQLPVDEE